MNSRERVYWYPKVIEKQHGEFCLGCGKSIYHDIKSKLQAWLCTILFIDHIDNNPENTFIENLQLLCPSCNKIKNPSKRDSIEERTKTPEMKRGDIQERRYRKWLREQTEEHDWIREEDAIDAGAEHLTNLATGNHTISPVTTKRYLAKLTSVAGSYAVFDGWICKVYDLQKLNDWLNKTEMDKKLLENKINTLRESFYSRSDD